MHSGHACLTSINTPSHPQSFHMDFQTMPSTYTVHTSHAVKRDQDRMLEACNLPPCENLQHIHPPATPTHTLSPSSLSQHVHHGSASPTLSNTIINTPAGTVSSLSNTNTHTPTDSGSVLSPYDQSSDYTEHPSHISDAYWLGDITDPSDPFFGVDFGDEGGSLEPSQAEEFPGEQTYSTPDQAYDVRQNGSYHPMSPDNTPSRDTASPTAKHVGFRLSYSEQVPVSASVSPQELAKPFSQPPAPPEFPSTYLSDRKSVV